MLNRLGDHGVPMQQGTIEKQFSVFKCDNGFVLASDHGSRATVHLNKEDLVKTVVSFLEKAFFEGRNENR